MKKANILFTAIILLFVSVMGIIAQERGLKVVAIENLGSKVNIGKQYALFIAIDSYRF